MSIELVGDTFQPPHWLGMYSFLSILVFDVFWLAVTISGFQVAGLQTWNQKQLIFLKGEDTQESTGSFYLI